MERGRYRTKQQETILECLKRQASRFLTVDQFMDCLRAEGVSVGQTTVYRFLERLAADGAVMKLPAEDGSRIRYCYADRDELHKAGKLVCLKCGRFFPLHCGMMDEFLDHIGSEHGFVPDKQHVILYGYCADCRRNAEQSGQTKGNAAEKAQNSCDICDAHNK